MALFSIDELEAASRLVYRQMKPTPQYAWPLLSERAGAAVWVKHENHTPTGAFKPTRLHEMWYSKKYDNAPMPHSVFFNGGYAVHATYAISRLGRPASHGCVRLHPTAAADFYRLVEIFGPANTRIVISE